MPNLVLKSASNINSIRSNAPSDDEFFSLKNASNALKHKNAIRLEIDTIVWFPTILDRAMLDLVVGVETNAEMKTFVNLLYG